MKRLNKTFVERIKVLGTLFLYIDTCQPKAKVNMSIGDFHYDNDKHECGTVTCHAGWFALANNRDDDIYHHEYAAQEMAEFLGFESKGGFSSTCYLEDWAEQNPELWGNNWGRNMFTDESAFAGQKGSDTITLKDIGLHWLGVADRIETAIGTN